MAERAQVLAALAMPEVKAAMAEAAAIAASTAAENVRTELLATVKQAPDINALTGAGGIFGQLALAIAEISDQGSQRKRVAPEILSARAKAHEKAVTLIMEARKEGKKPEYQLVSKVYLNERFIEPFRMGNDKRPVRQEIVWTGMPNEAMRPMNDVAKEIYAAFRESIGTSDKIATLDNRKVWVTPGGLTVKGDAPARAFVAADPGFSDDLTVNMPNDPTAPEIHVLGTVAPPARQNYSGAH